MSQEDRDRLGIKKITKKPKPRAACPGCGHGSGWYCSECVGKKEAQARAKAFREVMGIFMVKEPNESTTTGMVWERPSWVSDILGELEEMAREAEGGGDGL